MVPKWHSRDNIWAPWSQLVPRACVWNPQVSMPHMLKTVNNHTHSPTRVYIFDFSKVIFYLTLVFFMMQMHILTGFVRTLKAWREVFIDISMKALSHSCSHTTAQITSQGTPARWCAPSPRTHMKHLLLCLHSWLPGILKIILTYSARGKCLHM